MLVWWLKKKQCLLNSDEKVVEVSGSRYVITLCIYDILCVILEVININMVIINSHLTIDFYFGSSLRDLLLAVSTEYTFHFSTNFLYTDRTCQDPFLLTNKVLFLFLCKRPIFKTIDFTSFFCRYQHFFVKITLSRINLLPTWTEMKFKSEPNHSNHKGMRTFPKARSSFSWNVFLLSTHR